MTIIYVVTAIRA